ncbi:MAG: hypothetical protein ABIB41_12140 [Nitrospirota bacterium]
MNDFLQSITKLLLDNREKMGGSWAWLGGFKGKQASKKSANKFFLGSILDYQIPAHAAWANARRFSEDILGDPEDLWHNIINIPKELWMSRFRQYSLHRFPQAHERVWRIGYEIVTKYDGDARTIWNGMSPTVVLERLNELKVGEQISRMVVGALCDTNQIQGSGDVKADIHVRRVLGRLLTGKLLTPKEALELTRKMNPENPWLLDDPLYQLGKHFCHASRPSCNNCYMHEKCTYKNNRS